MKKAFLAFPYKEPYENIFTSILTPILKKHGYNVIRADSSPGSELMAAKLDSHIKTSHLVVLEVTDNNPNVYFEFGKAEALRKKLILLTQKRNPPVNTRHLHHLHYSVANPQQLRKQFGNWIQPSEEEKPKINVGRGERGEFNEHFADAVFILQRHIVDPVEGARKALLEGSLMPTECVYGPEQGGRLWLKLCRDTGYELYQRSLKFAHDYADEMIEACGKNFYQSSPDFVSLGPGDGAKDLSFIKSIIKRSTSHNGYYYPYDVSSVLLAAAIKTVTDKADIESRLKIKAVMADFESLALLGKIFNYRTEPNLYALLGNSLGNMPTETAFLGKLIAIMDSRDRAIIEVRLLAKTTGKPGGSDETRARHAFTPLELLGVRFNEKKFSFDLETSRSCIDGTKTLVARYSDFTLRDRDIGTANLYWIHHYDLRRIREVLSSQFNILKEFVSGSTGYFVLSKKV